jgi:hypothetical protein
VRNISTNKKEHSNGPLHSPIPQLCSLLKMLKILQSAGVVRVFATSTCWLSMCLTTSRVERLQIQLGYSAGSAMRIVVVVVVVDREEVECCATARSDIRNPPHREHNPLLS